MFFKNRKVISLIVCIAVILGCISVPIIAFANSQPTTLLETLYQDMVSAKSALDAVYDKVVFSEDYEDLNDIQMGAINKNSTSTINFSVEYPKEYGNTYANVLSTGKTWYGINIDSSKTYTALSLDLNTEYILTFRYKTVETAVERFLIQKATTQTGGTNCETLIPNSYSYAGVKASSAGTVNGSNLDLIKPEDGWTDVEIRFTNNDAGKPYIFFYTHVYSVPASGAVNGLDDILLMKVSDYETLNTAKTEYEAAKVAYELAKDEYDASLDPSKLAEINLKKAENNLKSAEEEFENVIKNAPFTEDFEGPSNKMGYYNYGKYYTETIKEYGTNHFAEITLQTNRPSSAVYGSLKSEGQGKPNQKFSVLPNTNYKLIFKYKMSGYVEGTIRTYFNNTSAAESDKLLSYTFENTAAWRTVSIDIKSGDNQTGMYFFFQILKEVTNETVLCFDDIMVVPAKEYSSALSALNLARDTYEEAEIAYKYANDPDKTFKADYDSAKSALYEANETDANYGELLEKFKKAEKNYFAFLDEKDGNKHLSFEHTMGELDTYYNIGDGISAQTVVDTADSQNRLAHLKRKNNGEDLLDGSYALEKKFRGLTKGKSYILKFDASFKNPSEDLVNAIAYVCDADSRESYINSISATGSAKAVLNAGKYMEISTADSGTYTYMILFTAQRNTCIFGYSLSSSENSESYIDNIKLEVADESISPDVNKICNPSFEIGNTFPWTFTDGLKSELVNANVTDGKTALKVSGLGKLQQNIELQPNTYYEWSFDLKFDDSVKIDSVKPLINLTILNPNGNILITSNSIKGGFSRSEANYNHSNYYSAISCGDHNTYKYTVKFYVNEDTNAKLSLNFIAESQVSYIDNMTLRTNGTETVVDNDDEDIVFSLDFEDGYSEITSASTYGGSRFMEMKTNGGHSGNNYVSLDTYNAGKATYIDFKDRYYKTVSRFFTVKSNETYRFSFWAKTNLDNGNKNVTVRYCFSQTASTATLTDVHVTDKWERYDIYITVKNGETRINYLTLAAANPCEDQIIYFDDLRLERIDSQVIAFDTERTWIETMSNRILNGTFEEAVSSKNWGSNSGISQLIDNSIAYSGNGYAKLSGNMDFVKSYSLKPSRFYTFAFSYKSVVSNSDLKIGIMYDGKIMEYADDEKLSSMIKLENTNGEWTRRSMEFLTPPDGVIEIVIKGSGEAFVDEFCLFESCIGLEKDVNDYTVYTENEIPKLQNIVLVNPVEDEEITGPEHSNDDLIDNDSPDTESEKETGKKKQVIIKHRKKKTNNDTMWLWWFIPAMSVIVIGSVIFFIILKRKKKGAKK